ncbi:hypothetical protein [Methanooceanicella nereidis]|nr:hypothetical protein [Methanocella sp. CWC-04]
MAVDVDHIPHIVFNASLPVLFNTFHFGTGRFLHPAIFYIGCACIACIGGLLVLDLLVMIVSAVAARIIKAVESIGNLDN